LRVFENREMRRIFGHKRNREEVTECWRNCTLRSCITYTLHQILLG